MITRIMDTQLLLGLLAGIPISVLANLLTPTLRTWFRRWWATTSRARALRRIRILQSQIDTTNTVFANPQNYSVYYILQLREMLSLVWIAILVVHGTVVLSVIAAAWLLGWVVPRGDARMLGFLLFVGVAFAGFIGFWATATRSPTWSPMQMPVLTVKQKTNATEEIQNLKALHEI